MIRMLPFTRYRFKWIALAGLLAVFVATALSWNESLRQQREYLQTQAAHLRTVLLEMGDGCSGVRVVTLTHPRNFLIGEVRSEQDLASLQKKVEELYGAQEARVLMKNVSVVRSTTQPGHMR